jgi:single-stranded DNA-specific DHH superfamily exonuclease
MIPMDRKILARIGEFLKAPGKRLLFYHHDADGVCSAALLLKFFKGFEAIPLEGPRLGEGFPAEVAGKKPGLMVFLDIPIDQEWRTLGNIQKIIPGLKILVVDHHILEKDLNSKDLVHHNPRFNTEIYLPNAYLTYRILEGLGKRVKPYKWIAGMGIIGDYGFRECRTFLSGLGPLVSGDPLESKLGRAAELISYAITLKGLRGARESLQLLLKDEGFEAFARNPLLNKWRKTVKREIDRILKDSEKEGIRYPGIGLTEYQIKSRLNITSIISTILAKDNPGQIIMIVKESPAGYKVSARCQSGRVNVGELFKKAVEGIGSGGGHKKAAGALVKDLELFRERLAKLLPRA